MAKRFTDSEKWNDPWFGELKPNHQLLWVFMLDTCDCAGVWKDQFRRFEFITGLKIDQADFLNVFNDRVIDIGNRSYFIPKFIRFQYTELSPHKNAAHRGVVKVLIYNGIEKSVDVKGMLRIPAGMTVYEAAAKPLRSLTGEGEGEGVKEEAGIDKRKGKGKASAAITVSDVPF